MRSCKSENRCSKATEACGYERGSQRDSPSCSWRAAKKPQCHLDPWKTASSLAHCSSTSSSSHTWKGKNRPLNRGVKYDVHPVSGLLWDYGLKALVASQAVRDASCHTHYLQILRCMLWFGHPVSTFDLVVEAWVHNHPWVWGATFRPKHTVISLPTTPGPSISSP